MSRTPMHTVVDPERPVPAAIKRDLLKFYSDPNLPIATKKDGRGWQQVQRELATLRQMPSHTTGQNGVMASER